MMMLRCAFLLLLSALAAAQPRYDLLLKGGHVIDPKNKIDQAMDVAIADGKIARVAAAIPPAEARRVADMSKLYVVPGLVDIHVHVYAGTGEAAVLTGDHSVYPDGFTFRSGVTTVVDAGTSGWRNFPDLKRRVIDRSRTRVLALLNICGRGMGGKNEQDTSDMDPAPVARMAKQFPDVVVGVKTAHYAGADWTAVENAVKAGTAADIPVMVDFGSNKPERPLRDLLLDKLRPGDIYTHVYSGLRGELTPDGHVNPALPLGRKRGIFFDVGHGGGSFMWRVAVPAFREGFPPDSISTDLHTGSMNAGMKDMINVMSKVLNEGVPLADVVKMSTMNPAAQIKRPQFGHLGVGAGADIAALRVDEGRYGFVDSRNNRKTGTKLLVCEMTVRDGRVVWDLNGRDAADWDSPAAAAPRPPRKKQ